MIHENLSHNSSGNGQEMGPALPINACLTDEFQVGFVNQRGRLKRMAFSFPVQVSRGKCAQFGVDVRKQLLFGMAISWFEFLQELSDPSGSARFHGHSTHQGLFDNAISLCPRRVALRETLAYCTASWSRWEGRAGIGTKHRPIPPLEGVMLLNWGRG
jgi:hypothetical protein